MRVFSEGAYTADWLIEEFGAPNFCRTEVTVLAPVDIPSGAVLGTATTLTTKYVPYDNAGGANTGKAAAAAGILLNSVAAEPLVLISVADSSDVATGTWTDPHMLAVGDVIAITGASDAELNVYATILSVPTNKTATFASSSVTDSTYACYAQKLNHQAVMLSRGPALVAADGIDWGSSDGTGVTAGTAELLALQIKTVEGV